MRSCCCTGYMTNPGGACCMDLRAGHLYPATPHVTVTPQGWQCPNCKRVYAPALLTCPYCVPSSVVITGGVVASTSG